MEIHQTEYRLNVNLKGLYHGDFHVLGWKMWRNLNKIPFISRGMLLEHDFKKKKKKAMEWTNHNRFLLIFQETKEELDNICRMFYSMPKKRANRKCVKCH